MAPEPPVRMRRILVVEDEAVIAGLIADMLAADGHEVDTAPNGLLALTKIQEASYDLIVSDMRMPELDGKGLYRELANRRPELLGKFLFITGTAQEPANRRFLEETGVPYLPKPFSMEHLHRVTQRILAA